MKGGGRARAGRIALAALALALAAGPAVAQEPAHRQFASGAAGNELLANEGAADPRKPVGLGRSGDVRVLVANPGELLDFEAIGPVADEFVRGHRWALLYGRAREVVVLGTPAPQSDSYSSGHVRAPSRTGVWRLESAEGRELTVITRVPATDQQGPELNGYMIGLYPTAGTGRTDAYAPPEGFVEVLPETRGLHVSEHLRLGQFLTKDQFDVWPKYVALETRLLDKLELLIDELNAMGVRAEAMHVMSGFRTPRYNGPGGGGRASLSRHMWGDAADVWIDTDGDGKMDDLNGDGRIDLDDATVMMRAVERVERKHPELVGGAGRYPTTSAHGPYVHIDVRGHYSRW